MHRVFVEKQAEFNSPAKELYHDLHSNLHLDSLEAVRVVQRYDVDGLSDSEFADASALILSEPQVETASQEIAIAGDETAFAVEYLPGQFDQRADSAAQCVQILTHKSRPLVASAKVIILKGEITDSELQQVKDYVINQVDSREASMDQPESLAPHITPPQDVAELDLNGRDEAGLQEMLDSLGLAMSLQDLAHCQRYFRDEEGREATITELRMLDTYWSDHCRHTTFATKLDKVGFKDGTGFIRRAYDRYRETRKEVYGDGLKDRPETLMDIALMAMKSLRKSGELDNLEVSNEINAASIVVPVEIDGETEDWLVMFKNETHNHPTEIEPFGGAATCLGGCIRDPLSGRSFVYQAMRVTGAADPTVPFSETLPGKLPQLKICREAAHGYSSYGNQIGLATGQVAEVYHPNYVAKRMEIGAVIAAAPKENVFRGEPATGDAILLIGGRTGRDGVGGATGSSKEHTDTALENSAEVQKGDAPTERKIQRLFRNAEFAKKIKVCNDFGAGGISVAIGELADSLEVDLDKVLKKYEGLDGTELAISESQERMAVVIDPSEIDYFIAEADKENLDCTHVANVTDSGRLVMSWRGKKIVDLSRAFLDTNGVQLSHPVEVEAPNGDSPLEQAIASVSTADSTAAKFEALLSDLNHCSNKGLVERFDSSVGSATVTQPFGGKTELTPSDAMVAKIPVLRGETTTCTHMAWGFNPNLASWSPFHGALYAVTESVCKLVSSGARLSDARLTLQEYFEKLGKDPVRWGKPFSALLGAYLVQDELRLAAIGGKDSMSGTFKDIDVPPTLVSFAVAPGSTKSVVSPEFKKAGSNLFFAQANRGEDGIPDFNSLRILADQLSDAIESGKVLAAHSLSSGGIAHGLALMSFGNRIGASVETELDLFSERYTGFLVESTESELVGFTKIGSTCAEESITLNGDKVGIDSLISTWTAKLEPVYPTQATSPHPEVETFTFKGETRKRSASLGSQPKVIIPAFPGSNCEYDSARAFQRAGASTEVQVFRNLNTAAVEESLARLAEGIRSSQILMLPGGFSAGDEPDGSGKFIATVLRNPQVRDAVHQLIHERDGLVIGICNGFQALIKTGLVPYGEIRDPQPGAPTLTFNDIGRHIARYATTRVSSNLSPWLAKCKVGELHEIAFSHGEGKFWASEEEIRQLAAAGQIAFQYTDHAGTASMDIAHNPNGSLYAVEGITSPCGRVLGKMGHSERVGPAVALNHPGQKDQPIFEAGVEYFA